MRNNIKSEVFSAIIGVVIGGLISLILGKLINFYTFTKGQEKWGFQDLSNLNIIISSIQNKKQEPETTTGRGQVLGIGYIIADLQSIYGKVTNRIYLASDSFSADKYTPYKKDIILLGGPATNQYAKQFLNEFSKQSIASLGRDGISWMRNSAGELFSHPSEYENFKSNFNYEDGENYQRNGTDYGLIVKVEHKREKIYFFSVIYGRTYNSWNCLCC